MDFMLNQDNQFSILQVLEQSPNYSQRDLAGKLGMSLGKANYCLKGLINKGLVIVGVVSHDKNIHDSKTLDATITHANSNRTKPIQQAVCDRGYVGVKEVLGATIILPKKALKRDNRYQRDKKRKLCKRRAAIEPIIGHLKSDFRLSRNLLKGQVGDEINVLMTACAWNLRKWLIATAIFLFWQKVGLCMVRSRYFFYCTK